MDLAVKVQRLNLETLFDVDLANLKFLAQLADRFDPRQDGTETDWLAVYDEYCTILYKEIDYTVEAQNGLRFQKDFQDQNIQWVKVPNM